MKIQKEHVVYIAFDLKDDKGNSLDSIAPADPLPFIFGRDQIIPGLESALLNKEAGEKLSVVVKPEDGFGEYKDELVTTLSNDEFEDYSNLKVGDNVEIEVESETGVSTVIGEIIKLSSDEATIDLNHPLANLTLHYNVEIVAVREQTAEELDLGTIKEFFPT